ncbi:MAG: FkbM family methyltransferase [Caldilineaceae bacterium]
MRQWLGLARSIVIYYGNPIKLRRMRHFYAQFIKPGDLCFDIGAHVGNRLWIWSQLGARVVALEPQPLCMALLRRWYGKRAGVVLLETAVGATAGEATLWISERTPTVTTLSQEWIAAVRQASSFATVEWQQQVLVPVTTVDALVQEHGLPAFCKIDVEGYELDVLRGLRRPLPVISFEYVPATKALAIACVERLQSLGDYRYNWSIGEEHRWQRTAWSHADELMAYLAARTTNENSGDIYCRLLDESKWID